jgi:hypothetical protein
MLVRSSVNVSWNQLTGTVPSALMNLTSLTCVVRA